MLLFCVWFRDEVGSFRFAQFVYPGYLLKANRTPKQAAIIVQAHVKPTHALLSLYFFQDTSLFFFVTISAVSSYSTSSLAISTVERFVRHMRGRDLFSFMRTE